MKIKVKYTKAAEELEFHGNRFFTKEQLAGIMRA